MHDLLWSRSVDFPVKTLYFPFQKVFQQIAANLADYTSKWQHLFQTRSAFYGADRKLYKCNNFNSPPFAHIQSYSMACSLPRRVIKGGHIALKGTAIHFLGVSPILARFNKPESKKNENMHVQPNIICQEIGEFPVFGPIFLHDLVFVALPVHPFYL